MRGASAAAGGLLYGFFAVARAGGADLIGLNVPAGRSRTAGTVGFSTVVSGLASGFAAGTGRGVGSETGVASGWRHLAHGSSPAAASCGGRLALRSLSKSLIEWRAVRPRKPASHSAE